MQELLARQLRQQVRTSSDNNATVSPTSEISFDLIFRSLPDCGFHVHGASLCRNRRRCEKDVQFTVGDTRNSIESDGARAAPHRFIFSIFPSRIQLEKLAGNSDLFRH